MKIISDILHSLFWRTFWRSPRVLIPVGLALIINLGILWLTVAQMKTSGDIVFRYSIYTGASLLELWYYLLAGPLLGFGIIILNTILAYSVGRYDTTVRYVFLWSTVLLNLGLAWLQFLLLLFNS